MTPARTKGAAAVKRGLKGQCVRPGAILKYATIAKRIAYVVSPPKKKLVHILVLFFDFPNVNPVSIYIESKVLYDKLMYTDIFVEEE